VQLIIWTDSTAQKETDKEYRYCLASSSGRVYGDGSEHGTYNRVTLQAILAGLERIDQNAEVHIYTDNRFILNAAAHHLSMWEKNGFVTSKDKPVKNDDLWKAISRKKQSFKLIGKPVNIMQRDWLEEAATEQCM